jgi:hypothetical protein
MSDIFAIWHKPGDEWLTDHSGRVIVFPNESSATQFQKLVDVEPPLAPEMEIRLYKDELDAIRYEEL